MVIKKASGPWMAAAERLLNRPALVLVADGMPWPGLKGACFYFQDWPVIMLSAAQTELEKISTLIHECIHFQKDHPPTFRQVWGRWVFRGGSQDPDREAVVLAAEQEQMRVIEQRLADFKRTTPRPVGWWSFEREKFAVAPGLVEKREAELLALVY